MATSETILSAQNHPGDSSVQSVVGEQFKGDGFYSRADGFHTVQYALNQLIGTVKIQGTLATTPTESDWFDIAETVHTAVDGDSTNARTGSYLYNFVGNYVWLRATAEFTDGTVNSVTLNH